MPITSTSQISPSSSSEFKPSIWGFEKSKLRNIIPYQASGWSNLPKKPILITICMDMHDTLITRGTEWKYGKFLKPHQVDNFNGSLPDKDTLRAIPRTNRGSPHISYTQEYKKIGEQYQALREFQHEHGGSFVAALTSYGSKSELEFVTGAQSDTQSGNANTLRSVTIVNAEKNMSKSAGSRNTHKLKSARNELLEDQKHMQELFKLVGENKDLLFGVDTFDRPEGDTGKEYLRFSKGGRLYSFDYDKISKGDNGFTASLLKFFSDKGLCSDQVNSSSLNDEFKPIHLVIGDGGQFPPIKKSPYNSRGDFNNAMEAFKEATKKGNNPSMDVRYIEIAVIDNKIVVPHRNASGEFNGQTTEFSEILKAMNSSLRT